jgi:hypothetical protein
MAEKTKRGRIMECLFCRDLGNNTKPELGMGLTCSRCFHILNSADQEYIQQLYSMSIEEGNTGKAKLVRNFLIKKDAGETHVRKTKKSKRNMVRKRSMRTVRPTRDQLRAQPTIIPLD